MTAHLALTESISASVAVDAASDRETHVIESDAEAIDLVRHLAAPFRLGAARRDHARIPPNREIETLTQAGFFGVTVPKSFGGAGVSAATVAESLRTLSAADAAIGQMAQNHFCWLPTVANGTPEQAAFFFNRFLAGDRIGYVHSGAVDRPRDSEHTVRRTSGGWLASGRRHYSPGAALAHWLAFTARFQVADQRSVFVFFADAAANGVTAADGEGETGRGMVIFDDVFVPDSSVFPLLPSDADGRLLQLNAGLIHAAIALGIAEDALSDASVYVRDLDMPAAGEPGQEHADQPFVAGEFAKFDAAVRTAGVLVRDAARAVDQARTWPSTGTVLNARLAVADARLFCADVANRICDEFYLLADVCATLGRYGFERHRRDARTHALHDPLQWWEYHRGGEYLNGRARPANPDT